MNNILMPKVQIWTDGGCSGNPGNGGVGIVLKCNNHIKKLDGYFPNTTNNQMELMALIIALDQLTKPCKIELYTDSKYLKNGMSEWLPKWKNNHWKTAAKKPVKNLSLWQMLDKCSQKHHIHYEWVRGHNGDLYNEMADNLCTEAIRKRAPVLNRYKQLIDGNLKDIL